MTKAFRQSKILEWVHNEPVSSQRALSERLEENGMPVAQSTLSRDIRELGLVKVRGLYQRTQDVTDSPSAALGGGFRLRIIDSGVSGNIVMIRTSPGNAHSLGVMLDSVDWPEILGTVAGDDTVFVLLRSSRLGKRVLRRIKAILT